MDSARPVPHRAAALPVLEYLAATLRQCWRAALREAFPERAFVVSLATEPDAYGPTLTFWQETPSAL